MEMEVCSEEFQLSCLKEENKNDLVKSLRSYVQSINTIKKSTAKSMGINRPLSKDFSPWWCQFGKSYTANISTTQSNSKSDPDSHHSWFSQSCSNSTNWLSGSQIQSSSNETTKQKIVEDIPVPSIYENKISSKGRRALKKERKAEREKTLGKKWFGMKAPDKNDPARMDMELIRMRGVLDPKRFYKGQDRKATPKFFQMGTVVDEGTDYYASRLTKKQRKATLVEELMADANIRQYNKKKYTELQTKMRGKKKMKAKKT